MNRFFWLLIAWVGSSVGVLASCSATSDVRGCDPFEQEQQDGGTDGDADNPA